MPNKIETKIVTTERNGQVVIVTIDSSFITRLAYDNASKDMGVEMKGGRSYLYHNVTLPTFKAIAAADSVGKAYNEYKADLEAGGYTKLSGDTK